MTVSATPSYAGEKDVKDAFEALKADPTATLVDVRTEVEWLYVGTPDLAGLGKKPILQEWQSYPAMAVEPDFAARLDGALKARGLGPDAPIYFLCRSGVRSRAAATAMAAIGWTRCFNVTDGFEGPRDPAGRRGLHGGWKAAALPWTQT